MAKRTLRVSRYGLPGTAAEIHFVYYRQHCVQAMVCREPPLRYTDILRQAVAMSAMVCREPPLRYTLELTVCIGV